MFRKSFGKWLRKAQELVGSAQVTVHAYQDDAHNTWRDPASIPDDAFADSDGIGSMVALHHTAERQIVQTKTDVENWIHAYDGHAAYFAHQMQQKIDAAFAAPMMKAIMWALEGELAGVTGKAQVGSGSWMEHTCEIRMPDFA